MIIYKATNLINKKVYIGKAKDFLVRVKRHKKDSYSNKLKKTLYYAIKKYGWSNFKWEIIGECSIEESNDCEIECIWLYQSNNPIYGYNKTLGGDGREVGYKHKPETIEKMKGKGHPISQEQKDKLRIFRLGTKSPKIIINNYVLELMYYLYENENWTFTALSKVFPYNWRMILKRVKEKFNLEEIRHPRTKRPDVFTFNYINF